MDPQSSSSLDDPYLWLEDVSGAHVLEWVERHNRVTRDLFENRPDFQERLERNLAILTNPERIAFPALRGDRVYNFWRDAEHERGILRSMSFKDWLAGDRQWQTLLDIDALAAEEGVHWLFDGIEWIEPPGQRGLVKLSRGGSDAVEIREFDAATGSFVEGGFFVPEAKSRVIWDGPDAIYVATDFGADTMTVAGYPRTVRRWVRGTALLDAPIVYEIPASEMGVFLIAARSTGRTRRMIWRAIEFHETEYLIIDGSETTTLDLPRDSRATILDDRLVVSLRSDWTVGDVTWESASVVELGVEEYLAGSRAFRLLVRPEERSSVVSIDASSTALVVTMLRNVSSEIYRYRLVDGQWRSQRIEAPEHGTIGWVMAGPEWDGFLFAWDNFLQPITLFAVHGNSTTPRVVQRRSAEFDAEGLVVEQREANSADGTSIPYFLVRRSNLPMDGSTPTILYAYGGYEVPVLPFYSGTLGCGWLERGGAYAIANIRGGGEFGPEWHKAALRENRQSAYDDFIAVAEHLIELRLTSPRHLGAEGGSNGGLLVGVVVTQRPELFGAAMAAVPVLDMRRYHVMHAGASWVGEYGNPDDPADWEFLSAYSPYHNLSRDARYPRMLLVTSTRDDRVHPGHARKMAARMEELGHPVLLFENTEGGHAAAAGHHQVAYQRALIHTYFASELGLDKE